MLKVYVADWCPCCERTLEWLRAEHIPFISIDVEYEPPYVTERLIEANGGKKWHVPTLEYGGRLLPITPASSEQLLAKLRELGAWKGTIR